MQNSRSLLIRLSVFYALCFAAFGALFPYLPLFLGQRGFSAGQIASVMIILPLANLLLPPIWGLLADALKSRELLLVICCIGCAFSLCGILWTPGHSVALVLWLTGYFIFRAPLATLSDAATHAVLQQAHRKFGSIRAWGSAGFGGAAWLQGILGGSKRETRFLGSSAAVYVVAMLVALRLPSTQESGAETTTGPVPVRTRLSVQSIRAFWTQLWPPPPLVLWLLIGTVFYYAAQGSFDVYFGMYLKQLGFGEKTLGSAWGIGVGAEVVMMFLGPHWIAKERPVNLLQLCAGVAALRWVCISFAHNVVVLVALQLAHAFTFGLWYLSLINEIQLHAPKTLRTSQQSLMSAAISVGGMTGYLGGAGIFRRYGGATVFRIAAVASTIAMGCYRYAGRLATSRAVTTGPACK